MDIISKIHPSSSKGHYFILVATDYFTKYDIPKTITTDQGTTLMSAKVKPFTAQYWIQLLHSSPYYPQANGQTVATKKKILISLSRRRWRTIREIGMTLLRRLYGRIGMPNPL
ncbi:uncharacterized protein LOC127263951 [Andrographis paniculata]|uniref:uncharacterized protein LOC127263951 n=1 Tax=Andrographis paniculata TaxID=175694 RepID=UPI0021E8BEC5|nr:uncharacterized protein LOC127263951 [Andrographis paniculata]